MSQELLIPIKLFFSFTLSFLVSFYLVPVMCDVAFRLNILDVPDGRVKKHKQPTPYLGGVALFFAFIVSLSLTLPFENSMFFFLIGSTILLFVGLIDDLVPFKPYQKFVGQVIAALCFLRAGFYLKTHFFNNYWGLPISFFWMVMLINAFNLVDIMDGLATLLASFATLSFLVISLYFQQYTVALLLTSFLGALIAFFWYNRPEAKIYLGDAGSLFIGGMLAAIPFMINWGNYTIHGYISPLVILAIPLLEIAQLVVIRTWKKIPFYHASSDHFALYLRRKGWSKNKILLYCAALSATLLICSFMFTIGVLPFLLLVVTGGLFLLVWFLVLFL